MESINQKFEDIIYLYFENDNNKLYEIIKKFLIKEKDNKLLTRKKRYYIINNILNEKTPLKSNEHLQLQIKDHLMISDEIFDNIRKYVFCNNLSSISTLKNTRSNINKEIKNEYKIQRVEEKGICCDLSSIIYDLNSIEIKELQSIITEEQIKEIIAKISIDGSNNIVKLTYNILNSKLYPTQSRDSCICVASYEGSETKYNINKFFSSTIENVIKLNGSILNKNNIFIVNDLKALGSITNLNYDKCFCPFCTCKKDDRRDYDIDHPLRILKINNSI